MLRNTMCSSSSEHMHENTTNTIPKCSPEGLLDAVFELLAAMEAPRLQNALQKASWSRFSSSWRLWRLRGSKMVSRRLPGGGFRALGGSGGSEAPKCSPESLLEAVFELLAALEAPRLQNAIQKASWRWFSSSWQLWRLLGSKMLSRRPPGGGFRALGGSGGSEAQNALQKASWRRFSSSWRLWRLRGSKCSPECLLETVFELLAALEAPRSEAQNALQNTSWRRFSSSGS